MLLSVGMIYDELKQLFGEVYLNHHDETMNLSRCVFYEDELSLRSDTIYIISGNMVTAAYLDMLTLKNGTAIIYDGPIEHDMIRSDASYLILKKDHPSLMSISNMILHIFEKYQKYEMSLRNAVLHRKSIQFMVDLATPLFGNEIAVRDNEYRFIAQSYPTIREYELAGLPQPMNDSVADPEVINLLKNSNGYEKETQSDTPVLYHMGDYSRNILYYDIFEHSKFLYRVKLSDVNQPLRTYDKPLLHHLAEMIREKYYYFGLEISDEGANIRAILIKLIENVADCTESDLLSLAQELRWDTYANYLCVCVSLSSRDIAVNTNTWYCVLLRQLFSGIYAFDYKNVVVIVSNLDISYSGHPEAFVSEFVQFLRDENMRAGFSLPFTNLLQLKTFYRQADIALSIGMRVHPYVWTHPFQNYIDYYIKMRIMEDFNNTMYCMPGLKRLQEYDRSKDTELLQTLKTYLDNNQNAAQTARALFIHRGTLKYRIEKIIQLLGFDLKDSRQTVILHLFLYLMELEEF